MGRQEPLPREVAGRALRCPHCGHGAFWDRKVNLASTTAVFFKTEMFAPSARAFVCGACGRMELFYEG